MSDSEPHRELGGRMITLQISDTQFDLLMTIVHEARKKSDDTQIDNLHRLLMEKGLAEYQRREVKLQTASLKNSRYQKP
jgi:hypothetical protein